MAEKKTGLSIKQILAGAGSAVTAAYVGTKLGVSGTIIGAAVGSVTGTLATHLYSNSLTQGKEALKKAQDVASLAALTKNRTVVTSESNSFPEEESPTVTTSSGTVVSTDVINAIINQDLQELETSMYKPWYRRPGFAQVAASSGIAMITAVGLLYALGSFSQEEDKTQRGGVSINSITVETHEPAPAPTIIYMPAPTNPPTPSHSEEPETPPTSPPEDSEEPPRPTTPPTPTKSTQEPTQRPPTPTAPPTTTTPTPMPTTAPPTNPPLVSRPTPPPPVSTPIPTPAPTPTNIEQDTMRNTLAE